MKRARLFILATLLILCGACTATSTKLAMQGSARSDAVRTAAEQNQHETIIILAYRALKADLEKASTPEERAVILNQAWNDRNLYEFWHEQETLARCLHIATVDSKLASSQGILNLLFEDAGKHVDGVLGQYQDIESAVSPAAATQPAN